MSIDDDFTDVKDSDENPNSGVVIIWLIAIYGPLLIGLIVFALDFFSQRRTHKSAGDKFNYTGIKESIVETMNEDIVIPEPVTNENAEEEIENEINHSRRFVKIIICLLYTSPSPRDQA